MKQSKEIDVSRPVRGSQSRNLAVSAAYSSPDFQTLSAAKRLKKPASTKNKPKEALPFTIEELFLTDS